MDTEPKKDEKPTEVSTPKPLEESNIIVHNDDEDDEVIELN